MAITIYMYLFFFGLVHCLASLLSMLALSRYPTTDEEGDVTRLPAVRKLYREYMDGTKPA